MWARRRMITDSNLYKYSYVKIIKQQRSFRVSDLRRETRGQYRGDNKHKMTKKKKQGYRILYKIKKIIFSR